MKTRSFLGQRPVATLIAFIGDRRGTSAIEFSIVSIPFIFVLLMILQMGIFYLTQSALDSGVNAAADSLVNTYYSGSVPSVTQASLRSLIVAKSGGLVHNNTSLLVDFRQLSTLALTRTPIGSTVDTPVPSTVFALRAQASVITFLPFMSALTVVRSSALVREQGQ